MDDSSKMDSVFLATFPIVFVFFNIIYWSICIWGVDTFLLKYRSTTDLFLCIAFHKYSFLGQSFIVCQTCQIKVSNMYSLVDS